MDKIAPSSHVCMLIFLITSNITNPYQMTTSFLAWRFSHEKYQFTCMSVQTPLNITHGNVFTWFDLTNPLSIIMGHMVEFGIVWGGC